MEAREDILSVDPTVKSSACPQRHKSAGIKKSSFPFHRIEVVGQKGDCNLLVTKGDYSNY